MNDYGVLGAQWYSYDNGLTFERVPDSRRVRGEATETTLTIVACNFTRGEITARVDLGKVFGVPPPPLVHVVSPEMPSGGIKCRAICGETVMHPQVGGRAVMYDDRERATCEECKR